MIDVVSVSVCGLQKDNSSYLWNTPFLLLLASPCQIICWYKTQSCIPSDNKVGASTFFTELILYLCCPSLTVPCSVFPSEGVFESLLQRYNLHSEGGCCLCSRTVLPGLSGIHKPHTLMTYGGYDRTRFTLGLCLRVACS